MKTAISILILLLSVLTLKAQTATVEIVFNGFYKVQNGTSGDKYYTILFDSTYYENENLQFLKTLSLGKNSEIAETLINGQTYNVVLQPKLQYSCGCMDNLINIRSGRGMTDAGTLFGSNFLEEQKEIATKSYCDYKVIEEYYILEIKTIAHKTK